MKSPAFEWFYVTKLNFFFFFRAKKRKIKQKTQVSPVVNQSSVCRPRINHVSCLKSRMIHIYSEVLGKSLWDRLIMGAIIVRVWEHGKGGHH